MPEHTPSYSVIVPAYQAAGSLGLCLEALNAQTVARESYEVIVVDDGSTDATAAIARDAGVSVITQPNAGPAAARNAGIRASSGDIILFTDADCEPVGDWIAQMVAPLADMDLTGVKGSYRTRQSEVVARLAQCEFEERYDRQERLLVIDFVDSYAAAFRATVLREVGGFDPAFPYANNEDVDLSYRIANLGHRLVFNRKAVVYHRHAASWRAYIRLKIRRGYWRVMALKMHPDKALRDSYTPQLLKLQVLLIYAVMALCLATLLWRPFEWIAAIVVLSLCLSTIPFARLVWRFDRAVTPWAPFFILARSVAFSFGIIGGIIGMKRFRPTTNLRVPREFPRDDR